MASEKCAEILATIFTYVFMANNSHKASNDSS